MAHVLLSYTIADDYAARREPLRAAHLAAAWKAVAAGDLLLGGAVGDPPESALLLFTSQAAARAFAEADPYVVGGLVTAWRVLPWTTVVGEGADNPIRPD